MARPKNKTDLQKQAETSYQALMTEVGQLSSEQIVAPGVVGEWSVKDVLAHLTAWHRMCLGWYQAGLAEEIPKTPSEKYSWKQTPELNHEIWLEHLEEPLDQVQSELDASHKEFIRTIESLSNDVLFESKPYRWTKSTTLGSYFVSSTSSHYEWARKEIRKGIKK